MPVGRVYIQKIIQTSGGRPVSQTIDVINSFDIYCKSIPFVLYTDVKEPYSNDWLDEDGLQEYLPQGGLKMKSYDMDIEWAYKGAYKSAAEKIKPFLDYLTGRSDGQPEMSIYCDWTNIGRTKIRLVKVSEKATYVSDEGNEDIVIFSTTLRVADPVTEFVVDKSKLNG